MIVLFCDRLTIIYHIDVLYLVCLLFKLATVFCPNYYYRVIVDCTMSKDRKMSPSLFRLVPYKLCFQHAILSTPGYKMFLDK